jgi:hypothetical protein
LLRYAAEKKVEYSGEKRRVMGIFHIKSEVLNTRRNFLKFPQDGGDRGIHHDHMFVHCHLKSRFARQRILKTVFNSINSRQRAEMRDLS